MSSDARLMQVLLSPHISEKASVVAGANNQYVFKVATDATKAEVQAAVEKMFEVTVSGVQVLNVKGKSKRFGRMMGSRSNWKKAYVTLGEGQEIDFLG